MKRRQEDQSTCSEEQEETTYCWRCRSTGHQHGSRFCPKSTEWKKMKERLHFSFEDPMSTYIAENRKKEQEERIKQMQALLDESSTDSSDISDSNISKTHNNRKRKKSKKKQETKSNSLDKNHEAHVDKKHKKHSSHKKKKKKRKKGTS